LIKDNFRIMNLKIILVIFNTFNKKKLWGLGFKICLLLFLNHMFYKKKVLKVIKKI